jgi:hypothetical protein
MKSYLPLLLGLLFSLCSARGQSAGVTVEVVPELDLYLPYQEIRLAIRITNLSGQKLTFGKTSDWLTFSVESDKAKSRFIEKGPVPVDGEFSIDSGLVGTRRIVITPHLTFPELGRFLITAHVRIPEWGKEISSRPKGLQIASGTRLRDYEVGVPLGTNKTGSTPEFRKYSLVLATTMKKSELFLRISDLPEQTVYHMLPIAPMLSISRPEAQIDQQSNIHILLQTGARVFNYTVINPQGEVLARQTHSYTRSRPSLKADIDGKIQVVGGAQLVSATDIPKPPAENQPAEKSDAEPVSKDADSKAVPSEPKK